MRSVRPRGDTLRTRVALAIYAACFAIGAFNHARDFWLTGWRPYAWAPAVLEAFWTALVLLDAAVIVLILTGCRRAGVALAAGIMIADVAANTHAWLTLDIPAFAFAVPLQTAFLGYVLGSAPFLWSARPEPACRVPPASAAGTM